MGLPVRLLGHDEYVVLHLRTHGKRLIGPALMLIVTGAAAGVASALLPPSVQPVGTIVVAGLALLVVIVWVLRPFLRWLTTTYTITNRRVISRRGILTRVGHDLPLLRITDVSYERSLSDRFWGCGTLYLQTAADGDPVALDDVPDVEQAQLALNELLFGPDEEQ